MNKYPVLILLALSLMSGYARAQVINTFAGTGTGGYSGDGAVAISCELFHPFAIATDGASNVYVADRSNNCIRKISRSGVITTIAGNGTGAFGGDGGPATAAQLNGPAGVTVDAMGTVYIGDAGNNRVRKIDGAGIITTIAGAGASGFGGDGGPATDATLSGPRGVAVDAGGNVYVADPGNNRIRKVSASGTITTYAGSATGGFGGDGGAATAAALKTPYGVAIDGAGNLYVADVDNERIRKINTAGIITTIAGNGTGGYSGDLGQATAAELYEPTGISIDHNGVIYIADGWNGRVRMINSSGIISTIAGNGTLGFSGDGGAANMAELNDPYGVAVDALGNIYIADYTNNRIRYVTHPTAVTDIHTQEMRMDIYPNPGSGTFTVMISSSESEPVGVAILTVQGEQVAGIKATTQKNIYITPNLPNGMYIVTASTTHGTCIGKLVIAH